MSTIEICDLTRTNTDHCNTKKRRISSPKVLEKKRLQDYFETGTEIGKNENCTKCHRRKPLSFVLSTVLETTKTAIWQSKTIPVSKRKTNEAFTSRVETVQQNCSGQVHRNK